MKNEIKNRVLLGTLALASTAMMLSSNAEADMYYDWSSQVIHNNDWPWPYIGDVSENPLTAFEYTWADGSYISGDQSGMQVESIGGNGYVSAYLWFGVDEDSTFTLSRTDYEGYFNFEIWDTLTNEILYLQDGDTYNMFADGNEFRYYINTTTAVDWTFTGSGVPAPGALALLGLAGLATRRRRR